MPLASRLFCALANHFSREQAILLALIVVGLAGMTFFDPVQGWWPLWWLSTALAFLGQMILSAAVRGCEPSVS